MSKKQTNKQIIAELVHMNKILDSNDGMSAQKMIIEADMGRDNVSTQIERAYFDLFSTADLLRKTIILGARYIENDVAANKEKYEDKKYLMSALKLLTIKYQELYDQAMCLIKHGYPDGVMHCWRTMLEYSVTMNFLMDQGEKLAESYIKQQLEGIENSISAKKAYLWAKKADCIPDNRQITFKTLMENCPAIKEMQLEEIYKTVSQSVHGGPIGVAITFNDKNVDSIGNWTDRDADYYKCGIAAGLSQVSRLYFQTFGRYLDTFIDDKTNIITITLYRLNMEFNMCYAKHFKDLSKDTKK